MIVNDFGNCGNPQKLDRIYNAIKSAQDNECGLVFRLDPVCYGTHSNIIIKHSEINEYSFATNNDDILVIRNNKVVSKIPWWDLFVIRVIW